MRFWSRAARFGFTLPDLSSQTPSETFPDTQCGILSGKTLAAHFKRQAKELGLRQSRVPNLVVILVGDDPASRVYVSNKTKTFHEAGFRSSLLEIPAQAASTESLCAVIEKLNGDADVHGVLVQLPLPKHIDAPRVLDSIALRKDVDGFLPGNMGLLANGQFTGTLPCTPFGVMALLAAYGVTCAGKKAVVVGRSNIVGKPMSLLLLSEDATVTIAHSRTRDLESVCRAADIVVAAAGVPMLITPSFIKPGAVVVDVGMHRQSNGKLCGDVSPDVTRTARLATPVPGGVGPMTIAMLLVNTAINAWSDPSA